jgi:glutamate dehydrogenase
MAHLRRADTIQGYQQHVFSGKNQQQKDVAAYVREKAFIPQELVHNEVQWFYENLGIDDMYFQQETFKTIADHIMGLYAAKIEAFMYLLKYNLFRNNATSLDINLMRETDEGAVYKCFMKGLYSFVSSRCFLYRWPSSRTKVTYCFM